MRQNGFTLIELLVGLLLASLLMLSMLTLFKQVSHIGLSSSQDTQYQAQLEIGMLTIQKLIQGAGYGSGSHDDVATGTFNGEDAIFWRSATSFDPDPTVTVTYQCRGFGIKIDQDGSHYIHRLLLLNATNCDDTTNLVNFNWQVEQGIAKVKINPQDNPPYNGDPVFQFGLTSGECVPFGIDLGDSKGDMQVKISGLRKYDYGVGNKERFVCLNNIKAP